MKHLKIYKLFLILLLGQTTKLLHLEPLSHKTQQHRKHEYFSHLGKKGDDFLGEGKNETSGFGEEIGQFDI
jgi:hypothetical protein